MLTISSRRGRMPLPGAAGACPRRKPKGQRAVTPMRLSAPGAAPAAQQRALIGAIGDTRMQIYVDPKYPTQALDSVCWQLKMLRCLLSQDSKNGIDLDEDALAGMCELLNAMADCVTEVGQMAGAMGRKAA